MNYGGITDLATLQQHSADVILTRITLFHDTCDEIAHKKNKRTAQTSTVGVLPPNVFPPRQQPLAPGWVARVYRDKIYYCHDSTHKVSLKPIFADQPQQPPPPPPPPAPTPPIPSFDEIAHCHIPSYEEIQTAQPLPDPLAGLDGLQLQPPPTQRPRREFEAPVFPSNTIAVESTSTPTPQSVPGIIPALHVQPPPPRTIPQAAAAPFASTQSTQLPQTTSALTAPPGFLYIAMRVDQYGRVMQFLGQLETELPTSSSPLQRTPSFTFLSL